MQGYILSVSKVKDEDLIVTILSTNEIFIAYRFYGARHSHINIGYKIDFELESNSKSTIPRLKDVIQLNYKWFMNNNKLYHWQRYIKILYTHLKDVTEIENFYFTLLDDLSHKINLQDSKRAILENYLKLLDFEGRLHINFTCLLCEKNIEGDIALVRSFIPTHKACSYSTGFKQKKIYDFFQNKSTISFESYEVDYLWNILLQGI